MDQFCLLACSNAVEGRSEEYIDWYVSQHLHDVLDIDGFIAGQFFRILTPASGIQPRWTFAAIYEMEGESAQSVMEGLVARRGTDKMPMTTAIDVSQAFLGPAEAVTSWVDSSGADEEQALCRRSRASHLLLALSNATSGKEQEYDEWYTSRHIPDVLAIPGFVGGQRWRMLEWGNRPPPTTNLAVYALNNPAVALAEMQVRAGTDRMLISPALDRNTVHMLLAEPITDKISVTR